MKPYHIETISKTELLVYSAGVEQLGSFLGDIKRDLDKLNFVGQVVLFQIGPKDFGNDVSVLSYDGDFTRVGDPFNTDENVDDYIEKMRQAA